MCMMPGLLLAAALTAPAQEEPLAPDRAANTVILDATAEKNLRLETETAAERTFETTVFAIGRIEEIPARRHSVSSRIAGRAIEILAFEGDPVRKDQVLARVESRQPGDPPPVVSLRALADGIVVNSHVLTGKPVEPDTDLLDIADRSVMWAVARIPEREAAMVRTGMKARIVIPALGPDAFEAELVRYGVQADREAGTVQGVFELPNPEGRLLPGMRAEFSIIVKRDANVLSVSRSAVQGDPARRVMYVRDFDIPHAFLRTPVVLGRENDRFVEVLAGLFPGDDVVTRGSYSLGFVGGGAGMSLKEALDAAHGHEHNEDGSEITPEQRAAATKQKDGHGDGHGHGHGTQVITLLLLIYAVSVTGLLFKGKKRKPGPLT